MLQKPHTQYDCNTVKAPKLLSLCTTVLSQHRAHDAWPHSFLLCLPVKTGQAQLEGLVCCVGLDGFNIEPLQGPFDRVTERAGLGGSDHRLQLTLGTAEFQMLVAGIAAIRLAPQVKLEMILSQFESMLYKIGSVFQEKTKRFEVHSKGSPWAGSQFKESRLGLMSPKEGHRKFWIISSHSTTILSLSLSLEHNTSRTSQRIWTYHSARWLPGVGQHFKLKRLYNGSLFL